MAQGKHVGPTQRIHVPRLGLQYPIANGNAINNAARASLSLNGTFWSFPPFLEYGIIRKMKWGWAKFIFPLTCTQPIRKIKRTCVFPRDTFTTVFLASYRI